jgi:excinuclease ABC subunit C
VATFDSKVFLANTTIAPGVYRMYSEDGLLLYVGKAKNLKKRLSSYFRLTGLSTKTEVMMSRVDKIEITITHTENEALLLESNLIKELKPRYNVLLRDSKSYPYNHLDTSHEYPRVSLYRGDRSGGGRYFGPYANSYAVRETLSHLQKVLPVRQCEDSYYQNRTRPCLQYQIKRCTAPCVDLISHELYQEDVDQAILFLTGKDQTLTDKLISNMDAASKDLDFEQAAFFRDRINALRKIQANQSINSEAGEADVLSLATAHGKYCVELMFLRNGRHSGSNPYYPTVLLDIKPEEVLGAFIQQFYLNKTVPKLLVCDPHPANAAWLEEVLSQQAEHKVKIVSNVRADRRQWLDHCKINADLHLRKHLEDRSTLEQRFLALTEALKLESAPTRIECFDVSHTQGEATVASCVVFGPDGAIKTDYRRYNINGIVGGDDYAAMEQVLKRRYKKIIDGVGKFPDLVLIDGGKGQLGIANTVVQALGCVDKFKLIGVAKGDGRKAGLERLFFVGKKLPLVLGAHSPALHLINQIRDEAHRFAISGHRLKRGKSRTSSALEEIPGIGAKRRQTLLKHFGGLQGVRQAGVKDLSLAPGVNEELAERIYNYLQTL